MACVECERDVPLENHELGLCATCNYKRRNNDDVMYPEVKEMFLRMCMRVGAKCPIKGTDIDLGSDIHHKKGRIGYADEWARENDISLEIDVRHFLACSREGHNWIEANPKQARLLGYSETRQDTDQK